MIVEVNFSSTLVPIINVRYSVIAIDRYIYSITTTREIEPSLSEWVTLGVVIYFTRSGKTFKNIVLSLKRHSRLHQALFVTNRFDVSFEMSTGQFSLNFKYLC